MSSNDGIMKYVSMLPVDKDKLVSEGINFFISSQDPENVEFEAARNGYAIKVYTDKNNVDEAKEFWRNNVHPKLTGDDE